MEEFSFYAYGGFDDTFLFLEFVDVPENLADSLNEDALYLGPVLEEFGWNGDDFKGLYLIRCRYRTDLHYSWDDREDWTEWQEISRTKMSIVPEANITVPIIPVDSKAEKITNELFEAIYQKGKS